ncbi:MAG: TldD/PmbA family protein, partial [Myxococcales bacterium]|nr:TldD/PmbA family protein [Myxococcales bacterium]
APAIDELADDLRELGKAKPMMPYAGPALLSGEASGLIFHEALGHRLEGERMVSRSEGQTFSSKVGTRILPEGVRVVDDPSLTHYRGTALYGHYEVDDEGVPAQPVTLVEDGILRAFLMSRSTAQGLTKSNGHGRHERFEDPMARMANLIVTTDNGLSEDELRENLLRETRDKELPHGIIVKRALEGETRTDHYDFQAFKGVPTSVWTINPKTGKEERVRDVSFIGTPLAALQRIRALGKEPTVDNSYCYAESGAVPVSTIAPSLLVGSLELQRASTSHYRKPRIPMPRV